jgi:cobalt-zinc-cadmium efflux system membrane fusion protein
MGLPGREALHSIVMCGDDMKRTWLVSIAGLAILVAGVLAGGWLTQRGILFTSGKAQRAVASAVSAVPPVRDAAIVQDVEVTVPAESVDRMHLQVAKVTAGTVNTEVRVPGTVQANAYREVHVTPVAGGVVTQVSAELGQSVKRGQPIAQVFSRELAEAQTAFVATSAELEAEHKNLQRTQDLLRMGATPRKELERVEANHEVHAAHLEEARQKLLLLGLDPVQIERLSAGQQVSTYISVPSPINGIVTTRSVNLGQVVGLGQDLFTVTDLSTVWVEGSVLEDDFSVVRLGSHASITTPAYPGRIYRGVVDYIEPRVDPQTRTAKVRVTIENPGLALRMGMYVDLAFTNVQTGKVAIAPRAAIQRVASDDVVYLPVALKEGRFLQRVVRLDAESGGGFRVLEGLAQGDTVVTEGSVLLRAESLRQHPR